MAVNARPPRRSALPYPHRFCCARPRSSNNCWLCRFLALSWPNLPCALKAAIGYGKRTLGDPGQSDPPRGPQQGLFAADTLDDGEAAFRLTGGRNAAHSGLIPSTLMIGHHLSAAAFRRAFSASGV